MLARHCPDCGEEFRAEIERCSDCGATLGPAVIDDEGHDAGTDLGGATAPPENPVAYEVLMRDATGEAADGACRVLAAAGVRFRVGAHGYGLVVSAVADDAAAARHALQEAGLVRAADEGEAVGDAGGPCPACATVLPPGTTECSSCGLVLGGDAPDADRCPECGGAVTPGMGCAGCG